MSITVTEVIVALRLDNAPGSGWMTAGGKIIEPRSELWLAHANMWVRADGMRASCWRGDDYFAECFGWLDRFHIRRAVRKWAERHDPLLPNNTAEVGEGS